MARSGRRGEGRAEEGQGAVKVREGAIYEQRGCARAALCDLQEQTVFNLVNMKYVLALCVLVAAAAAAPQREGAAYSKEAIKQAQSTFLIPKDAVIQKVQEGVELAAYESIPGNQRINLFEILGDQLPSEVINNLQIQIDHVGQQ